MKNNSDTSAVEGVDSREQGNTKTQGGSRAYRKQGIYKGINKKEKHTKKNKQDVNLNNDRLDQQKQSKSHK